MVIFLFCIINESFHSCLEFLHASVVRLEDVEDWGYVEHSGKRFTRGNIVYRPALVARDNELVKRAKLLRIILETDVNLLARIKDRASKRVISSSLYGFSG